MMRSLNSALSLVEKHCRVLTGKNCALYVFKRTLCLLYVDCRTLEEARHRVKGIYMIKTEMCTDCL